MENVLIIGGTSGIGEAAASAFVARGDSVTVAGRDEKRLRAALGRLGDGVKGATLDAGDPKATARLAASLAPIDVLVLSVGSGIGARPFEQLALERLRTGFDGKFWPQIGALQQALPSLAETAAVVFVTAASARAALPGTAGLAAINGALDAMVPPLAAELAPKRVNAVSPGVVDTPWWAGQPRELKEATFEALARAIPAGRIGEPADIATAILFFADAEYVTGTVVDCAGGAQLATGPPG